MVTERQMVLGLFTVTSWCLMAYVCVPVGVSLNETFRTYFVLSRVVEIDLSHSPLNLGMKETNNGRGDGSRTAPLRLHANPILRRPRRLSHSPPTLQIKQIHLQTKRRL